MRLVGDPERDAATHALRSAYARGYLTHRELAARLDQALAARSARELGLSLRHLPAGRATLMRSALGPLVSSSTGTLRHRARRILRTIAIAAVTVTSAILLLGLGLWTAADGISARVGLGFLLVWLALNAPVLLIWRRTNRMLR
jgi:hypothetical protein